MTETRELWQKTFEDGFCPFLNDQQLKALEKALETDDPSLLQCRTTSPSPASWNYDNCVEGACAISYCGWQGSGLKKVGEVEVFFAQLCYACDMALGEQAACKYFLNWFDDLPRERMRPALLASVQGVLADPGRPRKELSFTLS